MVPEFGREDIREFFLRSYRIVYKIGEETIDVLTVFEGHRMLESDTDIDIDS
jgi:plasmid stabilization system protein ParE